MSRTVTKKLIGTIRYTSMQAERMHEERGRERFVLSQQDDGTDVLISHSEIDDPPSVVRDVVLAMRHADSSPLDCSVLGGQLEGTGWMNFQQDCAACESWNRQEGRIHQLIDTPKRVTWLQAHPLVGDALLMRLFDLNKGAGLQHVNNIFLTSPDHRGATGPSLFATEFDLVYVGEENLDVSAGAFRARHFQVTGTAGNLPEEHPPYDVWCTADDDYLFLKAAAGGYMSNSYELIDLTVEE